jgi:hypothetical protein
MISVKDITEAKELVKNKAPNRRNWNFIISKIITFEISTYFYIKSITSILKFIAAFRI